MEKYIIFNFECDTILVKYHCNKEKIFKSDIEDCMMSYLNSTAYNEDNSYDEIVHDVMSSFDGVEYEIINTDWLDVD